MLMGNREMISRHVPRARKFAQLFYLVHGWHRFQTSFVSCIQPCLEVYHLIKIIMHFSCVFQIVVCAALDKVSTGLFKHVVRCTRLCPWYSKSQAPPNILPHFICVWLFWCARTSELEMTLKLFRVEVRSFPKCDRPRSTQVRVAFAT